MFVGATNSEIEYSEQELRWRLTIAGKDTSATSASPFYSYVLGKHTWTGTNDSTCSQGETYIVHLKLTGCEEGEFTCNDGQCVQMEHRCDQVPQCRDKSDEDDCEVLVLEKSYNKKVPPITTVSNTNFTIVPVNVNVSIVLMKIVKMEETDHKIDLQFEVILKWRENGRVKYHNLKDNTALNNLPANDIEELWLPLVIYENTDQKETTRLGESGAGEWSTIVTVTREEKTPVMSGLEVADEIAIFEGNSNTLTMNQTYTHQFQCKYHLDRYPFDTQVAHTSGSLQPFPPELLHRNGGGESRPDDSEIDAGKLADGGGS
jgi:hypothetical protein